MIKNSLQNKISNDVKTTKFLYVAQHLSPEKLLDYEVFKDTLYNLISDESRYSILIRVSYSNQYGIKEWKSLGVQIGLYKDFYTNKIDLLVIHNTIISRLEAIKDLYHFVNEDIHGFQLLILSVEYTDVVKEPMKKLDIKNIGDSKDLINVATITKGFNKTIPLTYNRDMFGSLLQPYIYNGNIIGFIKKSGEIVNFINLVNQYRAEDNKIINFSSYTTFYSNNIYNQDVVVAVTENNKCVNDINIYTIYGTLLLKILDSKIDTQNFTRKIGNVNVIVNEKEGIKEKYISVNFQPIKPIPLSGIMKSYRLPDPLIGTMDIETYTLSEDIAKVYAIGFYINGSSHTFYIDSDLDSDKLVKKCLDELLIEKYHNYTIYIHNLGDFDGVFLLSRIVKLSIEYPDIYGYKPDFRNNKLLYLVITKRINKKTYRIKLLDSIRLLSGSLVKLSETFKTDIKKGIFPYNFVNSNTLFYNGYKPHIKYFNKDVSLLEYDSIEVNNWSTKEQTLLYLEKDLIVLYEILSKFKEQIFFDYNTQITKSSTISGVAMNIYLNKFYNNNIPLVNKKSVYKEIKKSYYGGITEVYKPYGKNLYYYDVNSLYPYSALENMPGTNCIFFDCINKDIKDCDNFYGFYNCKIQVPESYLGFIPTRVDSGIIMPTGFIEGWYYSEELLFALEQGCKIFVLSGYQFDKNKDVFKDYIEHFYNIKSTTNSPVIKVVAKSLLNNLIGRFGLNIEKSITQLVSMDKYNEIVQCKKIHNIKFIEDMILVTHDTDISHDICKQHNVDYQKALIEDSVKNNKNNLSDTNIRNISIPIASAVTSLARIFMNKVKLDILKNKGQLYYTDTDSIITDIKLDESIVGDKIGQFKLVDRIKEGYFISNKAYGFINSQNKTVITVKGLNDKDTSNEINENNNLFNYKDLHKLLMGDSVNTTRTTSIKNYETGSVVINDKSPIKISNNSYTKRVKIYDNNNIWINTKPIHRDYHTSIKNDEISIIKKIFFFILLPYIILTIIILCKLLYILSVEEIVSVVDIYVNQININNNNYINYNNIYNKHTTVTFDALNNFKKYSSVIDINEVNNHSNIFTKIYSNMKANIKLLEFQICQYEDIFKNYKNLHEEIIIEYREFCKK